MHWCVPDCAGAELSADSQRSTTMETEARVEPGAGAITPPEAAPFVTLRDPAKRLGPDGRPAVSRRAPKWQDVPDEKWNDWRLEHSDSVNELQGVGESLQMT